MDEQTTIERTETPMTTAGDTDVEPFTFIEGEQSEAYPPGSNEGDTSEGEYEGEQLESEYDAGELMEGEQIIQKKEKGPDDGELLQGEEVAGEHVGEETKTEVEQEEMVEEEQFGEEAPPDPAAPLNFSDSKEALRDPFVLRNDQLSEVELLWELYQNYTPAYTDIDNYITEKELVYMLKCLFLMTYTPEQLMELITFCVRPPHPKGHINYEQFLRMVTLRQRDFPIEEELHVSLQVFDPDNTGLVDRENLRETLTKQGHKMHARIVDNFIKEVDMSNDGTIGIEDVVGTMCIDLNTDDLQMLRDTLNAGGHAPPPQGQDDEED